MQGVAAGGCAENGKRPTSPRPEARRHRAERVFLFIEERCNMEVNFLKTNGLVPAVIQDAADSTVLMVGFMNQEALDLTRETGRVTFYSRSRDKLWTKGETSGHYLLTKEILVDCDEDTLVIKVEALGPGVCHNGFRSCFYRRWEGGEWKQVDQPAYDPASVYKS